MSKKAIAITLAIVLGLATVYYYSPGQRAARVVQQLIERNTEARGGEAAWRAVNSLRLTGQMDLGQGLTVPYTLEQKRPGKMRLEFVFEDQSAVQATDGKAGWKISPFQGRMTPEPMVSAELAGAIDTADLYGMLFDYSARGHRIELEGHEMVAGLDTFKLKVTLPQGSVRWVYLDATTALEIKMDTLRQLSGRERLVETFYYDWKPAEGLLIPRRQDTWTEGDKESHFLTVERVTVNPQLDDSRFAMPANAKSGPAR